MQNASKLKGSMWCHKYGGGLYELIDVDEDLTVLLRKEQESPSLATVDYASLIKNYTGPMIRTSVRALVDANCGCQ
jgi:hypothetical protein